MCIEIPSERRSPDRTAALRHKRRVHDLKAHVAAFVVGTIVLGSLWALTEYLEADGWPQRFGDEDAPGTWHLWIFYVVGVWALLVALKGVATYFGRPMEGERPGHEEGHTGLVR